MSAEKCPVCGAVSFTESEGCHAYVCGKDERSGRACSNAERLAIERAKELARLKNESITAEVELAAGQPALMLSAYDLPIHWKQGDVVRISLERPGTL